jgi:hypothetical protein
MNENKKQIIYRPPYQRRNNPALLDRLIEGNLWMYHQDLDSYRKTNIWDYWHTDYSSVKTSFKMDYATEAVALSFRNSIFKAALSSASHTSKKNIAEFVLNGFSVIIENLGGSLRMNGQTMTRTTASRHLASLCFQTNNSDTREQVRDAFFKIVSLPPDINYVILNRTPYSFYDNRTFIKCRLNTQQISSKEIALEISEGIWGKIPITEFMGYLSHYLHGTQRGSWVHTSPENLYRRLMGKEGRESDIKVMKNFLMQNRTSDLIAKRANVLLQDTLEKYPLRMRFFQTNGNQALFVKGVENDWIIFWRSHTKDGRQLVSTKHIGSLTEEGWTEIRRIEKNFGKDISDFTWRITISDLDEGVQLGFPKEGETDNGFDWQQKYQIMGVCVDNLQRNSPQVDQAISRALVVLNDKVTKPMVSTMHSIYEAPNRIDFSSLTLLNGSVYFSMSHSQQQNEEEE